MLISQVDTHFLLHKLLMNKYVEQQQNMQRLLEDFLLLNMYKIVH